MKRSVLALLVLAAAGCGRSGVAPGDLPGGPSNPWVVDIERPGPAPTPTASGDDFGDGVEGEVTIPSADVPVNTCTEVTSTTPTSISVANETGFAAGRRVLLHQVQESFLNLDSANATADPGDTGHWEFATLVSVKADPETALQVTDALQRR